MHTILYLRYVTTHFIIFEISLFFFLNDYRSIFHKILFFSFSVYFQANKKIYTLRIRFYSLISNPRFKFCFHPILSVLDTFVTNTTTTKRERGKKEERRISYFLVIPWSIVNETRCENRAWNHVTRSVRNASSANVFSQLGQTPWALR